MIKDSGTRENFVTGAVRDGDPDRPRPDLISPFALMRVGDWMAAGAKKYSERNWEKGIPYARCYESLFRHLLKFGMRMTDEDHLAAIIFNAQAIMHFEETGRWDLDDMPYPEEEVMMFPAETSPEVSVVPEKDSETEEEKTEANDEFDEGGEPLFKRIAASFRESLQQVNHFSR